MTFKEYVERLRDYLRENDPELYNKIMAMIDEKHPSILRILDEAHMYSLFFGFKESVQKLRELIKEAEK
jgi:hypothetical protein